MKRLYKTAGSLIMASVLCLSACGGTSSGGSGLSGTQGGNGSGLQGAEGGKQAGMQIDEAILKAASSRESWVSNGYFTKDNKEKTWYFMNMDVMPILLEDGVVHTYDDVREAIAGNETISEEYVHYFYDYLDMLEKAYPNLNLFCLYNNMKTLKFRPENAEDTKIILGANTSGNYKAGKNTLYFNYEFPKNVDYLLFHEMSHMVTNHWATWKKYDVIFDFDRHGQSVAVEEGLNSVFLENVIGYTIEGMSYQLPANHLRVLLEYSDYPLEDILANDCFYFENVIKEAWPDAGSGCFNASLVNQMIGLGFDYKAYDMERDYADYITGKCYFSHNIDASMTRGTLIGVYETLVERLVDNVFSGSTVTCVHTFEELQKAFYEAVDEAGIASDEIPTSAELTAQYEYPRKAESENSD